jgi:hypothetical protein
LSPAFSAGTEDYTVNVASGVTSVTVTPSEQDTAATTTVNGQPTNSGQTRTITLNGAGSNTLINIAVTAPNGNQKTYSVNVIRAALGGNNNLSALTVTPGPLVPSFTSGATTYSVDVVSTVTSVTVTPTLQDTAATMTISANNGLPNGQPTNITSGQARTITLRDAGLSTTINIEVRAPNGSQKPYTITVGRSAPPPPSGNNNLQSLTVSPGTLSPPFNANRSRTDYAVNDISSSATSILVTAAPEDSSATVTINTQGGNSRSIPLPGGPSSTEIDVRVIAPNGNDKTYPITVTQPAPAAPPAPASPPDLIKEDDTCPPVIPPDPNNPDPDGCVSGTSRSDNRTTVTTPRFSIAPPAGQTPSLYIDGKKDVSASFDLAANTLRPSAALSDGVHTITYTVTNAGGESPQSPSLSVTIDTVAPAS